MKRVLLLLSFLASSVALAAPGALNPAERARVMKAASAAEPGFRADADAIWRFAEVGYQEKRSSAQLQDRLKAAGFTIEAGVAGMPTAFVATFRTGAGPTIGYIAEFDALPGLSQAAVAQQQPITGQDAGHGCGHNLFGAASVGAAIALKAYMVEAKIDGEVRVYGAPAEEGGSGKVYMVRAGLFDGVDAVLHFHPDDHSTASQIRTLANISGKFRFRGVAAHAAGHPDKGVSALDAVTVMNTVAEHLREHVPDGTRIHYIITNGGSAPNVVPEFAESYYYVRHLDPEVARAVWKRLEKAAEGVAIATGTRYEVEVTGGAYPLLPNRTLMGVMDASLRAAPREPWNEEDRRFADAIAATLTTRKPIDQAATAPAEFGKILFGSTDVGDVSWHVPTAGMEIMTWVPGTAGHSWQAAATSGSGFGQKGGLLALRSLALAGATLLRNPATLAAAKAEFDRARGTNFTYAPMVGDRTPPLDYRNVKGP